jgi:hypothetical protein
VLAVAGVVALAGLLPWRKRRAREPEPPPVAAAAEQRPEAQPPRRALAVLLAVLAAVEALSAAGLVLNLPDAADQARQYLAAPLCGDQNEPDCRSRLTEHVVRVAVDDSIRNPHTTVVLADPFTAARQSVELSGTGPLGRRLHPDDQVQLVVWQGQPVALRAGALQQDAGSLPTDDQRLDLGVTAALVMFLPLTARRSRQFWRRRSPVRSAAALPVVLAGAVAGSVVAGALADRHLYLAAGAEGALVALVGAVLWRLHRRLRRTVPWDRVGGAR